MAVSQHQQKPSFEEVMDFTFLNCPLMSAEFVFKPKQIETLSYLYKQHDCLTVLPTGYGKSIIFQCLPWFCQHMHGKTHPMTVLVISPLNSLMRDQVMNLSQSGVRSCYMNVSGW